MNLQGVTRCCGYAVRYVRHGGNHIHIELAVQTLLNDLHMQQSEETATESESERQRRLRLEGKRCVVELQFLQRSTQILILVGLDGIYTREDHRLYILKSGDSLRTGACHMCDGITHLYILRILDTRADVTYVARANLALGAHLQLQYAHLVGIVVVTRIEELDVVALADGAIEDTEVGDNASEGVEHRVKNQCLQRSIVVTLGSGDALDDSLQNILDTLARLARCQKDVLILAADKVDNLVLDLVNHCRLDVDFVQYRDDFEVVADCKVEV